MDFLIVTIVFILMLLPNLKTDSNQTTLKQYSPARVIKFFFQSKMPKIH